MAAVLCANSLGLQLGSNERIPSLSLVFVHISQGDWGFVKNIAGEVKLDRLS